jgi:hypothetical protein
MHHPAVLAWGKFSPGASVILPNPAFYLDRGIGAELVAAFGNRPHR